MTLDLERHRREQLRWQVLFIANLARPDELAESLILSAVQAIPLQATQRDLRREIDYLEARQLLTVKKHEGAPWSVELTRHGIDVAEYTVDCEAGIARPKKYWD